MRKLLLLAFVASLPLTASAQWTFDTVFPQDTLATNGNGFQGIAVDDDGTVFLQTFNTAADSIDIAGVRTGVFGLRIFNPDGSEVDASPLVFIDYADGTTPRDTLGYYSYTRADGTIGIDTRTGRGIRYCEAEDAVYISQFATIFKIDADTYKGLARVNPFPGATENLDASLSAVGVDDNCNVTVQSVGTGGRQITQFDPNLEESTGTVGFASDFTRTVLVSPDGNTVFETAFENPYAVVYQRENEFAPYDSLGYTFAGLRIEATAVNPKTGYYWVSSGNPLNPGNNFNDIDPATGDTLRTFYTSQTFYAFDPADLFDADGNPVLNPMPVDSLLYREPGIYVSGPRDVGGLGRPRSIAFTADGDTAYVALFNLAGGAQRFIRGGGTATEPGAFSSGSLEQNRPNPFSGTTDIRFELDRAAQVTLRVYDTTGRQVATLADGPFAAGPHAVSFDAGSLAAGVYVYTLNVEGEVQSRRMMVVR
ncbi:T9SS type A sorting domain-containing protein [Rubrivirga sp.]|uniref:T9SS type A sorting domain-containing protein n=1 Tax=Rubrivirga sp. TaxID=1885344 RepID=UPI003B527C3E